MFLTRPQPYPAARDATAVAGPYSVRRGAWRACGCWPAIKQSPDIGSVIFSSLRTCRSVSQSAAQYAPEGGGSVTAGGGGTVGKAGGIGLDGVAQPVNVVSSASSSTLGSHSLSLAAARGGVQALAPAVLDVAGVLGMAQGHGDDGGSLTCELILRGIEEPPKPRAGAGKDCKCGGQNTGHASLTLDRPAATSGTGRTGTATPAGQRWPSTRSASNGSSATALPWLPPIPTMRPSAVMPVTMKT